MQHNGYLNRRSDSRRSFALAAGLAAVFLLFTAILPAFAWADDAGFLAKVEGRVDILRVGQSQAVLAMENDPVSIGDVVRTKSGGRVEIHFNDDTVLRLAPGSRLKIDKYVFNPDNTRKSAAVTLLRGKLRAVVTKASSVVPVSASTTTFNINTPTAVAGVLGTDLFVFYDGGATGVLFKDGHGIVFNPNLPDQVVRVPAGFVTFITGGAEPPLEPRQATELELAQHVRDTTVGEGGGSGSGGPSAGGGDDLLGYIPPPPEDGGDGGPGAGLTGGGTDGGPLIPVTVYDPELLGDTTPPVIPLIGTYTAWSGLIDYDYNDNGLYNGCDGLCGVGDTYGGLAGGVQAPWLGTTSLTLSGPYWAWQAAPYLWNAPIYSYNQNDYTYTTYDGGAFWGVTGGVWQNGTIDAKVYSLYIDPAGNAGILKGDLTGAYSALNSIFEANGQWTPTILTTGLDPTTLGSLTYSPDLTWWTYGASGTGSFTAGGSISEWQTEGRSYSIPGENWGILQNLIVGSYSDPASDIWSFSFNQVDYLSTNVIGTQTEGTQWSNGVLKGQTYGYGADITATPRTWISVGDTLGTFDATNLTWQAAQTSAWIETSKYLAMTQTSQGQAALGQLNIPFVEVGRANLTGTGAMGDGNVTVNMNNVTFLAYSNGAMPKIWGTGDVNGGYTCTACGAANVVVAGNGLNANFDIKTFDTATTNNWIATVNGGGAYSGTGTLNGTSVQMTGAAAGTIDTATTSFTGTAAGTVQ
ncbi:MAG: FecR domain-containing protein [Deltaproteobacteria bacterium]|nr:FecR domain-containing protein [Deltaproteobacteria bacterium]